MPDSGGPAASTGASTLTGHLSIGEVLALLLEEFPDVTISKIRFLESQGLVAPERTASGYRKFYDDDIILLRCILREQRENYLPLRVIKDRIEAGEIDPTSETPRPRGIKNVPEPHDVVEPAGHPSAGLNRSTPVSADALFARTDGFDPSPEAKEQDNDHSSSTEGSGSTMDSAVDPVPPNVKPSVTDDSSSATTGESSSGSLGADELCKASGLSQDELSELESYGVISPDTVAGGDTYDDTALEIATVSKRFLDSGVEARHLRGWRVAADREVGLLEQLIQPLLRQRNPAARAEAVDRLTALEQDGGKLRAAMMKSALRHHTAR